MAVRQMAAIALLLLCASVGATAKRSILQVPEYQSTGIGVQNADNPALTQSADNDPSSFTPGSFGREPVNVAAAPETQPPAAGAPADGPGVGAQPQNGPASQPPLSLTPPTVAPSPPTVAPSAGVPVPPAVQPPTFQPPTVQPPTFQPPVTQPPTFQPPVAQPPTFQPPTALPPVPFQAQVPAPAVVTALPPVPVPAPAPVPQPPQCGQRPQCRVFVEDMLCCQDSGTITNKQHAVVRLQCTHPVNYYAKCFNITGPTNMTAFNQFETAVWSTNHVAQINMLSQYRGQVTVDIEKNRVDQYLSADCGLYVTPCLLDGELISEIAPVNNVSFTTIATDDFLEVASNVDVDIDALDSLVYADLSTPSMCQQVNLGNVNGTFFNTTWVDFAGGESHTCNVTALTEALAPAPSPAQVTFDFPAQASG